MPPVNSRTIRISKPDTTSGFSVDASASCGYKMAGRKLPNRPNSERIFSKPRSGRIARSKASHLGPPTAPKSTASTSRANAKVESAKGTPCLSIAAPPSSPSTSSKPRLNFSLANSKALTASDIISGPMPSPGNTRIFLDISNTQRHSASHHSAVS